MAEKGLGIIDAIRLKHRINTERITYHGLNAKDVSELASMPTEDYRKILMAYAKRHKEWTIIPNFVWYALSIVGVVLVFSSGAWYLKLLGLIFTAYSGLQIGSRIGNYDGFTIGYEWGLTDGVHKTLGIDNKEAADIRERAVEIEMDERLLKKLDKGN